MNQSRTLLLASGSPRRAELLTRAGIRFEVTVTDVDETVCDGEAPPEYVRRLALEKAVAGKAMAGPDLPVLGADTVVLLEGEILGKPEDTRAAIRMLERLSGKDHQVLSAVALLTPDGGVHEALNTTLVRFAPMPAKFIEWLCESEHVLDKAGAYAIQGAAGQFIERIDGSYSGVMGLPLHETCSLLRAGGVLS